MYILLAVAAILAIYALVVARNAHGRLDNVQIFHVSLSKNGQVGGINFYALQVSGRWLFLEEHSGKSFNITRRIYLVSEVEGGGLLTCETSSGNSLLLSYNSDESGNLATQSEELPLGVLSIKGAESIRGLMEQAGWSAERAFSGDLRFAKDNLEIYIAPI